MIIISGHSEGKLCGVWGASGAWETLCEWIVLFICVYMCYRLLWSALAVKSLLEWTSWWRGSSIVAASPAVRMVPRRGRWCSSIQQTTAWILRLYLTPLVRLSLTTCPIQTHTPISMLTHTQIITHYHIHHTEGRFGTCLTFPVTLLTSSAFSPTTLHCLYQSVVL